MLLSTKEECQEVDREIGRRPRLSRSPACSTSLPFAQSVDEAPPSTKKRWMMLEAVSLAEKEFGFQRVRISLRWGKFLHVEVTALLPGWLRAGGKDSSLAGRYGAAERFSAATTASSLGVRTLDGQRNQARLSPSRLPAAARAAHVRSTSRISQKNIQNLSNNPKIYLTNLAVFPFNIL